MLGVPWSKTLDTILVIFPGLIEKVTKSKVKEKLAKIYNTLGLSELITLEEKFFAEQDVNPEFTCLKKSKKYLQ